MQTKKGLSVSVDPDALRYLSSPVNTITLAEFVRRVAEQTMPEAGAHLQVIHIKELSGVLVTVRVTVYGNYEDEQAAEVVIGKFQTKPWHPPNDKAGTNGSHDRLRVQFLAYLVVPEDRLTFPETAQVT